MALLIFEQDGEKKFVHLETEKEFTIGRSRSSDLSFCDIPAISRHHCSVYYCPTENAYAISDLHSTNGTMLNGARISSDVMLKDGDRILIGPVLMRFTTSDDASTITASIKKVAAPVKMFSLNDLLEADLTQTLPKFSGDEGGSIPAAAASFLELKHGDKIQGTEIIRKLGDGVHSSVYLAKSPEVKDAVALKFFNADFSSVPDAQRDFLEALQALSEFSSPAFIQRLEAGIYKGHCFYTMNCLTNANLARRIARNAPFSELESAYILRAVGKSLELAFMKTGQAHLNLKPTNVLFTGDDDIVISDFGLSPWYYKYVCGGLTVGSPYYASPEQIAGRPANWHSDVYSLGIIFFQMLTGALPFNDQDEKLVLKMHIENAFPSVASVNPNISITQETASLLSRMTSKNAAERYESWQDFQMDVQKAVDAIIKSSRIRTPYNPSRT